MANIPGLPFKLTAADMGGFDLGNALKSGFDTYSKFQESRYQPQMLQAKIQALQGQAQKNALLGQLYSSLIGGQSNESPGSEGVSEGGSPFNNRDNLKAAVIKGLTGIDPYLMSPQQKQQMDIEKSGKIAGQKANITTGSSDVARESLQDIVSMPKEYLGPFGSLSLIKDRMAASKGDKSAKERLIQAAVAERLVPEYAGFQLMSQGQRATVPALEHQRSAIRQGWPSASHFITNNLTPELQKEAEKRHNQAVKEVNRIREKFLNSRKRDGGQEEISPTNVEKFEAPVTYSMTDIEHTAQKHGISTGEVINRLSKKHGVSTERFMEYIK
jgi:hypothetical protein